MDTLQLAHNPSNDLALLQILENSVITLIGEDPMYVNGRLTGSGLSVLSLDIGI